ARLPVRLRVLGHRRLRARADVIRLLAPPPAAASGRRVLLITVGLFAVLGVLAGATPIAPAVPVGLILGVIGVALALGSPWHGTIAVLMATIFLPTPFSVHLG